MPSVVLVNQVSDLHNILADAIREHVPLFQHQILVKHLTHNIPVVYQKKI